MSWVRIDDNFPHHPKTVEAGKEAGWLFLCGLCYCRKYHTNGFIPKGVLATLGGGVNPRTAVDSLVRVGFWESRADGYLVHDYTAIYPEDVQDKTRSQDYHNKKRAAGRQGGLASGEARRSKQPSKDEAELKQTSKHFASSKSQPLGTGNGSGPVVDLVIVEGESEGEPRLDEWFAQLRADYPVDRVTSGHLTEHAFFEQLTGDARGVRAAWADMRANLENQKQGYEWRVKRMVPTLEKWLREGRWRQRHEEHPPSVTVSEKTAHTLTAAAAFIRGGTDDERS